MRSQDLEHLTTKHAGCLVATYADITSGVTLIAGFKEPLAQEALDAICKDAALRLGELEKPPFGVSTCPLSIKLEKDAVAVYLRDPDDDSCALSLICKSTQSLPAILGDALSFFEARSNGAAS